MLNKKILPIFLLLFLILWTTFFVYHKYLQNQFKNQTRILTSEGIDSLEKITLGGIEQWILIRGWDKSNPVVLFLHGGPGAPLFTYARDIGVGAKLEKHFVMVYWEQRGTGKSFSRSIPKNSMTIEQFVSDCYELSKMLKHRFGVPKIILVARSWGSLIGLMVVHQYPELFYSYVGIGQMIHPLANDKISYEYTIKLAQDFGNQKAITELKKVGYPPYGLEKLNIQRRWLTKFYRKLMAEKFNISRPNHWKKLLSTPEYTFMDILKMGFDPDFSARHLWNEDFYQINLFEQIPQIDIPVYFLAGRYDYFTPSEIIQEYYQELNAPNGKYLIWFDKSGHNPEREEVNKFYDVMVNKVLGEVSN
jgi:pimeloyl-ACP methyl ester carboxylesterase